MQSVNAPEARGRGQRPSQSSSQPGITTPRPSDFNDKGLRFDGGEDCTDVRLNSHNLRRALRAAGPHALKYIKIEDTAVWIEASKVCL